MHDEQNEESAGVMSGLKLWADVGLQLGKSVEAQTAAIERQNALQTNTPFIYQTVASGVYTSGTLVLNLGTPDMGTYWEVESISIGGTDLSVTAAGSAGVYITAIGNTSPGMTAAMDYAAYLPNVGFYGSRKLYVKEQENIIVGVWNGTNGQTYVANCRVSVVNDKAARGKAIDTI